MCLFLSSYSVYSWNGACAPFPHAIAAPDRRVPQACQPDDQGVAQARLRRPAHHGRSRGGWSQVASCACCKYAVLLSSSMHEQVSPGDVVDNAHCFVQIRGPPRRLQAAGYLQIQEVARRSRGSSGCYSIQTVLPKCPTICPRFIAGATWLCANCNSASPRVGTCIVSVLSFLVAADHPNFVTCH